MGRSVLDDLGEEVTGIVTPVSICMALTVALVRILNPSGESDSGAVFLASAYYTEQAGDTTGEKLTGAVVNALIFVGVVTALTFVLVLLFKYGCTRIIYAYMGFAGFSIFFVLGGIITLQLLQKAGAALDLFSFTYMLFNFAVVGSVTLFFFPAPLFMKQCYLVITGVTTAYVFTWIPEWTTWVMLVVMALYDVVAVLVPGGPLRMLVEMAQEREETIPALVYEARPTRRGSRNAMGPPAEGGMQQQQQQQQQQQRELMQRHVSEPQPVPALRPQPGSGSPGSASERVSPDLEAAPDTSLILPLSPASDALGAGVGPSSSSSSGAASRARQRSGQGRAARSLSLDPQSAAAGPLSIERSNAALAAAPQQEEPPLRVGAGTVLSPHDAAQLAEHPSEATALTLPESIKLGLGDFIFYSVLVGRAAMYDFLTVFACYLAIVAGLCCTLLWLAMAHKALPALPISIALAVSFYFISRFVMEPVILPMCLEMVYF